MVWILCNSQEVMTLRFLRKRSVRRIHWCECRLVSSPLCLFVFFRKPPFSLKSTLLKSRSGFSLPEGSRSAGRGSNIRFQNQIMWRHISISHIWPPCWKTKTGVIRAAVCVIMSILFSFWSFYMELSCQHFNSFHTFKRCNLLSWLLKVLKYTNA